MAGPSRPTPPSAFDGYRRLERTRVVTTAAATRVSTGVTDPAAAVRTRPRVSRVAGALRLAGFVAVLAIIVGTSVSLASADTREAARSEPVAATRAVEREQPAEPAVSEPAASERAASEPAAKAADVVPRAAAPAPAAEVPAVAAAPRRTQALPFTGGELAIHRVLLAGATLVLLGMLVQIAGQPLPAAARVRSRA